MFSVSEIRSALLATAGEPKAAARMLKKHAEARAAAGGKRTSSERAAGDESPDEDTYTYVPQPQQQQQQQGPPVRRRGNDEDDAPVLQPAQDWLQARRRRGNDDDAAAVRSVQNWLQSREDEAAAANDMVQGVLGGAGGYLPHVAEVMMMNTPPREFRQLIGPGGDKELRAITQSPSFQAAYRAKWYVDVDMVSDDTVVADTLTLNVAVDSTVEDVMRLYLRRMAMLDGDANPSAFALAQDWTLREYNMQGTLGSWWSSAIASAEAGGGAPDDVEAWTDASLSFVAALSVYEIIGNIAKHGTPLRFIYRPVPVTVELSRAGSAVLATLPVAFYKHDGPTRSAHIESKLVSSLPRNFLWAVFLEDDKELDEAQDHFQDIFANVTAPVPGRYAAALIQNKDTDFMRYLYRNMDPQDMEIWSANPNEEAMLQVVGRLGFDFYNTHILGN